MQIQTKKNLKNSKLQGDVAIIGMSCVFPKAPDLQTYWENIVSKVDAIDDPPEDWGADQFFDPNSTSNDRTYCKRGGYLGGLSRFNPLEYGIMPVTVEGAEPEHFMALRVAHEAMKDAGFPDKPINREQTEVILGRGTFVNRGYITLLQHGIIIDQTIGILRDLNPEYTPETLESIKHRLKSSLPPFSAETAPGLAHSVMAGLIANRLNLNGTHFVLDAACASCLIALEIGIRDLLTGKCDTVLTGGVQISTPAVIHMLFTQLGALSRHPHLRSFDKDADGTMLGEGIGMIVLKRLEDAERDGHRIYAVIKGVGSSSDGKANSLLAPRVEGEELALRRAYEAADISPSTIGLIEAHGTAISLGDVTELQSLTRVFGTKNGNLPRCAIGSVKSMIGHLIPAAGIAGIIKTALAIHHKILPPTLHCDEPNPKLEIEKSPFYINTETRPWIHNILDTPRRAGVNAFGFGGINAHAILEEYTGGNESETEVCLRNWDTELFILHGNSKQELVKQCEKVNEYISNSHKHSLVDLAYTINSEIHDKHYRLSIIASTQKDLIKKLNYAIKRLKESKCTKIKERSGVYFFDEPINQQGKLAFLFPGEGSQYVNMLSDLCMYFPEVRSCFDLLDQAFIDHQSTYIPSHSIFPLPDNKGNHASAEEKLWQMNTAVDAVISADRALYKLFSLLGIKPQAILGHSSGEFMALEAAGAIELSGEQELIQHIRAGNNLIEQLNTADKIPSSVLLAIGGVDRAVISQIVSENRDKVFVSMDNCPNQIIICADKDLTDKIVNQLRSIGAICQRLPFGRPYHTPLFESACEPLREFFGNLKIVPPKINIYSCLTAKKMPVEPSEISNLAVQQWALPVRFCETIESMYNEGIRIFLEVGPRANLTGFVNDILKGKSYLAVASNIQRLSGITQLNHALGLLAAHGVPMRLDYLYRRRKPEKLDLDKTSGAVSENKAPENIPNLSLAIPTLSLGKNGPKIQKQASTSKQGSVVADNLENLSKEKIVGSEMHSTQNNHLPDVKTVDSSSPAFRMQNTSTSRSNGTRTKAMQEYFNTMNQFLNSQNEIMQSYLKQRTLLAGKIPGSNDSLESPEISGVNNSQFSDKTHQLPFIGKVVKMVPEKELVVTYKIDLDKDIFLQHHTLGGRVSLSDKDLLALPTMPLSMSMEIMAEVALLLMPGKHLIGMENIKTHHWIILENENINLKISSKVKTNPAKEEVDVQLWISELDPSQKEIQLVAEGTMIFGNSYPGAPVSDKFLINSEKPSDIIPEQLYPYAMFHGTSFQSIKALERYGDDGIETTLEVPKRDTLFKDNMDPHFVSDPVMLDGAGQTVGLWSSSSLGTKFVVFPVSIDEVQIFAPPLPTNSNLKCQARITIEKDIHILSDINLVRHDGYIHIKMKGLKHKRINMPKIFHLFRGSRNVMLSTPWMMPVEQLEPSEGLVCCRPDQINVEFWEEDARLWRTVLAHIVLSRRERSEWQKLRTPEIRRTEWLLARVAGKDAVRILLKKHYGVELWPADIEIQTDEHGKPIATSDWSRREGIQMPSISLAHTQGNAIALAAINGLSVGIDIENINRDSREFEELTLNLEERDILSSIKKLNSLEWSLRIWCAKEAVSKALGMGLPGGPGDLIMRSLDPEKGVVSLEVSGKLAQSFPQLINNQLQAYTLHKDGFIVASATYTDYKEGALHGK